MRAARSDADAASARADAADADAAGARREAAAAAAALAARDAELENARTALEARRVAVADLTARLAAAQADASGASA